MAKILLLLCLPTLINAWREWPHYGEGGSKWKRNWLSRENQNVSYWGGPGGRYGHTMVLHDSQIILFGGRNDEIQKTHIPKTYAVKDNLGTVDISSYWEPVYDCDYLLRKAQFTDPNATIDSIDCNSTLIERSIIDTTFLWNDVWMYDLNCTREWQKGCSSEYDQWKVLHEGAVDGGCKNIVEGREGTREICTVPSERFFHGAARFNDSTMLIYGGFSHRCEEYCDDMWSFDLRYGKYRWTEIYPLDHFSSAHGPGRRMKFSYVTDGLSMAIFGGMSLWDGYLNQNSDNLDSESLGGDGKPEGAGGGPNLGKGRGGGFLDDFWIFRKRPLTRGWGGMTDNMQDIKKSNNFQYGGGSDPENYASDWEYNPQDSGDYGFWERVNSTIECEASTFANGHATTNKWSDRDDEFCRTFWPEGRAGHTAVLDTKRQGMWLHGGFTSYFPYPSTGASANSRTSPFNTFRNYLDDLWFFNFTESMDEFGGRIHHNGGRWHQVRPIGHNKPSGRMEHTLLLSRNALLLQGGFAVNHHFNDTWIFNITSMRWLQKHLFERARYPPNCTADADFFGDSSNGCFELRWPKDRERDAYQPFEPLDDRKQRWYAPDFTRENITNSYYGILDKGEHIEVGRLLGNDSYTSPGRFGATAPDGTPLVPYAKTGPRQWVRNVSMDEALRLGMPVNFSRPWELNVSVYERCTSVYGEPTRSTLLDGNYGRSNHSVQVAQPRRQRYGWDGCRDRYDNRSDLPKTLQWDHPSQRSGHTAVYNDEYGVMMVYGGRGPAREEPFRDTTTFEFKVKYDFWQFSIHNCQNNCSNHGFCSYGYCTCEDGYYGYDCSNISCPGDYCYYDEYSHEQICQHCCSAGYNHSDTLDVYIDNADSHKVPCSQTQPGLSHGICDGYGTCQCAPPFLSDDCGTKDCLNDCNYNGYCSIEYPVSRCVCNPTYFGESCEFIECLNNCSYPNGICNFTEGECYCNYLYNPYDNERRWATSWENQEVQWEGEDCSYLTAYAAAVSRTNKNTFYLGILFTISMTSFILFPHFRLNS